MSLGRRCIRSYARKTNQNRASTMVLKHYANSGETFDAFLASTWATGFWRKGVGTDASKASYKTSDAYFEAQACALCFDIRGLLGSCRSFSQIHLALRLTNAGPRTASNRSLARPASVP